ncbi:MAG: hypothetical protein ACLQU5_00415 [Isosphaeraceae bacterium]
MQDPARRTAFLEQFLESIHRVEYILRGVLYRGNEPRVLDARRADPTSELFDPIKGAALRAREGNHNEACWLVFLFTHFGKNLRTGYRLVRDVYGSLGQGPHWDWVRTSTDPEAFRIWLASKQDTLKNDGIARYFGNHRKYISLDPNSAGGTGQAIVTYVNWVTRHGTHAGLFSHAANAVNQDPRRMFNYLYRSMRHHVASFGRTGRFDYLTMLGKLGLAAIQPGSTYMTGSTGSLDGARLLFGSAADTAPPKRIDGWLVELETALGLELGMQVLEDALCNWQKNPDQFVPFRG